jgi:hypothetical protein
MEQIGVSKIPNKRFTVKRDIVSRVIEHCDEDIQHTTTPNRVDVSGTGITLPGCADVSQAVARPCRIQLCTVLGSSGIKLSEHCSSCATV